jgi:GR25 family glycosyltransferase involved in LPS biosynthesis
MTDKNTEMDPDKRTNNLVFVPNGRFGNAFFRYLACAVVNIFNPSLNYTLQSDLCLPAADDDESKFTYYPGLDSEGNDAYRSDKNDLIERQADALKNPLVFGFNTLGYLKHTIDCDSLTSNIYINQANGQGLYVKKTMIINDDNFFDLFYKKFKNLNVIVDGYFQFGHLYLKYKTPILNYLAKHQDTHFIQTDLRERYLMRDLLVDMLLPPDQKYDVVIHIRLGDFNGRVDYIELEYYLALFETINFKDQTVCLLYEETVRPADRDYIAACIDWFQTHNIPIRIETNSLLVDFNIMKQAKTLICSMSTLSWAAAYLSNHIKLCYMPNYNFFETTDRSSFFFHKPIENTRLYAVKSTPQITAQIKPYILTLPEYAERLSKLDDLNHKFARMGLDPTIYNGVHGKDIHIYEAAALETSIKHITWQNTSYFYDTRVRLNGQPISRGEFGCAWSHLNLLRQLIEEEPSSNIDYYLILEDDVKLVKPVSELYQLLNHLPADADICNLAKSDWYPFIPTQQVNAFFYECEKRYFNKTTAYVVSKKGARKVIDYTNNSINVPIDDLFNMMYRLTPDFKYYIPETYFFKEQENITSSIVAINDTYSRL